MIMASGVRSRARALLAPTARRVAPIAAALLACLLVTAQAQPAAQPVARVAAPSWSALSPAHQQALATLHPTWDTIDAQRKLKWIEVADRFPRMPADERQRVQERMAAWAAMKPAERAQARIQFQETRDIGPEERHARWQAYQALPEDERKRLASAAKRPPVKAASAAPSVPGSADPKRNLVAATPSPAPRSVSPAVLQAKPGASTTTIATTAKPPPHHQPGLPKIVATPNFVDPTTLLPRRGPQAAAMRAAASADPTQQP